MRRLIIVTIVSAGGAAIMLAVMTATVLRLGAYRLTTGSMAPNFPAGTVVVTSGLMPAVPHRALTFVADGRPVTHVLVGYDADGSLITRGTANPVNDAWRSPVFPRDVRGRVLAGILLFAPAFWGSGRGPILATAGLGLVVGAVLLRPRRATMDV